MIEKTVVVTNRLGIHARPATVFVQAAAKFQADIFLSKGDVSRVNGKSIMGVMMLAAEQGAEVLVEAEGTDAAQAAVDRARPVRLSSRKQDSPPIADRFVVFPPARSVARQPHESIDVASSHRDRRWQQNLPSPVRSTASRYPLRDDRIVPLGYLR